MSFQSLPAEFWGHVEELRKTVILCLMIVVFATMLCFCCFDWLYPLITKPLYPVNSLKKTLVSKEKISNLGLSPVTLDRPAGRITFLSKEALITEANQIVLPPHAYLETEVDHLERALIILGPLEGFTTSLKVCFWLGLLISFPLWGYLILCFILPALKDHEKSFAYPFFVFSLLFLIGGVVLALNFFIPLTNEMLQNFNQKLGMNLWSVSHYIQYTLIMSLSALVASELVLILFFLVHYGKISDDAMKRGRPAAVIGIFVLSALMTPPDIITQILFAVPLVAIYEIAVLYARFRRKWLRKAVIVSHT